VLINIIWEGKLGDAIECKIMAPPSCCSTAYHSSRESVGEHGRNQHFWLQVLLRRHRRPLLWPSIGFLIGATYQAFPLKPSVWLLLFVAAVACQLLVLFKSKGYHRELVISQNLAYGSLTFRISTVLLLLAAGYMAGSFRSALWTGRISAAENLVLEQSRTGFQLVAVQVVDNPRESQNGTTFIGKLCGIICDGHVQPDNPELTQDSLGTRYQGLKVNVHLYGNKDVKSGEFVVVKGKLSIPSPAKNPGEFDYRRYLMGKQVLLELKGTATDYGQRAAGNAQPASVDVRARWNGSGFGKGGCTCAFQRIAHYIEARIDAVFSGEQTKGERGIIKALLLGDRGELPQQDSDYFRTAGLYRFIAIAGFHVRLVAGALERTLNRLTNNVNLSRIAGLLAAFLLAGLSGWSVGPLRAFLCVLLRHLAFWCRRKYDILAAFAACAIIIGWRIPYPLKDVSFQLTFSGMLAGWVTRESGQALARRHELGFIRRYLVQSCLMAALLLPLLATHFQDVSMAGFFLGGVWALLSVAVTLSTLPVLCFPLAAARWLGWFPFFVVRGLRELGAAAAKLPLASFAFPRPGLVEAVAYLGLVFVLIDAAQQHHPAAGCGLPGVLMSRADCEQPRAGRWVTTCRVPTSSSRPVLRKLILLVLCLVLWVSVCLRYYMLWPQVVFLSVGQADSAVIRTRGAVIVLDTGTEASARRVLTPYLKREGIRQIDLCIISHLHEDHAGGLGELCRNFKVRTIMTCPGSRGAVYQMAEEHTVGSGGQTATSADDPRIIEAGAGDVYQIGGAVLTVIHPPKLNRLLEQGVAPQIHTPATHGSWQWQSASLGTDASLQGGVWASGVDAASQGFDNADSLVIGVGFGDLPVHVEFWGDAPGEVVMDLLANGRMSASIKNADSESARSSGVVSIVKVPHHGSPDSLVYGFYQRVQGGAAVISVGPNSYGHPSPDVIGAAQQSGLEVFRTDRDGAVTVKIYPGRVKVSKFVR
jgi:competence protein ComEC